MLFGNALDPTGRANHPKLASARRHGNQMGTVLAKDKPVWRSRYNETLITGHTREIGRHGLTGRHLMGSRRENEAVANNDRSGWRSGLYLNDQRVICQPELNGTDVAQRLDRGRANQGIENLHLAVGGAKLHRHIRRGTVISVPIASFQICGSFQTTMS
jgi:hypothetical protein